MIGCEKNACMEKNGRCEEKGICESVIELVEPVVQNLWEYLEK